jgi:hypothetical protein
MTLEARLDQLETEVRRLRDRSEILDCIMRQSRGVDRHDAELMNSSYHEDGLAAFGSARIPAAEFGEWSKTAHAGRFRLHMHNITTHTCEIEGDVAYCESYCIAVFLSPDQRRTSLVASRYLDQLERRDGEWKIVSRRAVTDIAAEGDASFLGAYRGRPVEEDVFWTRNDPSYQRPIDLSGSIPGWH